jgi:ketosteroid isomerase-like protein
MSTRDEQLVELTQFAYAWWNREKETPPVWHPEGEYINSRDDPDHAVYKGIDAVRKQNQGWAEAYPDLTVEPLEIRVNGDLVFAWTRFTGHGAESGAALEMELAQVATWEGDKLMRTEEFMDRDEGLAAVGLQD